MFIANELVLEVYHEMKNSITCCAMLTLLALFSIGCGSSSDELVSKIEAVEPIRLAQQIIPENEKGETESMKTIYLAGGCFWGTQKFFDQFEGILETEVGYANGPTENPSYREVCMKSGHAETVKVVYDPEIISLEELIEYYFMTIDPLAYHRQGADKGIQYRTGIYYVNDEDLPVLEACYAKEQEKYSQEMEVELLPLENFYTAEEYHQKYLDKNPGGYCHIPKKLMELQKNAKGKEKDEELRERIGDLAYEVTQNAATERLFTGEYKMKLLCIGDSNTYGYDPRSYFGSSYPDAICWTNRLSAEEVINCGINGLPVPTDSGPWLNLIDEKQPDLVIVMLGTNDLLEGCSAEIVSARMENFLKELLETGKPILLIAPPSLKPGAWVEDESQITESHKLGALYRDICERLDMDFADAGDWNVELAFDGVHFTEYGHEAFAKGLQNHLNGRE